MSAYRLRLIYLDRYHLGDPLFLRGLAHRLGSAEAAGLGALLVHGSGDEAEQVLEAEGAEVVRRGGILADLDSEHAMLVERAVRQTNKRVVATLTEFGVAAVSVQGSDRGVVQIDESGGVRLGPTDWLFALARQRVVPVVSALTKRGDAVLQVDPAKVLVGLAERAAEQGSAEIRLLARERGRYDESEVARAAAAASVAAFLAPVNALDSIPETARLETA